MGPFFTHPPATARDPSVATRLGRVLLIMGGIAAAIVVAVSAGAVTLPGTHRTGPGAQASPAAERMAADRQWASATCGNILDWKHEIQRDATSLNLGFGALARIQDAIAATTRMSDEVGRLGLPPTAQSAQTRAEIDRLRSDILARVRTIEGAAGSVAQGNLAAIGTLLSDLESDTAVGPRVVSELRHVVSVDLGLSLVETRACRQLVGIAV